MEGRLSSKFPLPPGEYRDAFMYESSHNFCDVFFTGKSDGRRHTGVRTYKIKKDGGINEIVTGMFDSIGNTHSYVDEGINCICKFESGEHSISGTGLKHEGLYNHGDRCGKGVQTFLDGTVIKGTWIKKYLCGPTEIQKILKNSGLRVTVFINFDKGVAQTFCKVVFHDDNSIYVGECVHPYLSVYSTRDMHGRGILLDNAGIHVGAWRDNILIGIEKLHLCDDVGTVVELEHFPGNVLPVEKSRSVGIPIFRVPYEDTSPLAELQNLELAKFLAKRRMKNQLQNHLSTERQPMLKDVCVFLV